MSITTERVLVLNASYEPLNICRPDRAQWLLMNGRAEVVSALDKPLRSATQEHVWPSVIRLLRYQVVPHFRKAYLTRKAVLQRDNYECAYCGGKADTMDHVYPRFLGGLHRWENVVSCCYPCNQAKGHKTLQELGWELRYRPFRPEGGKRIIISSGVSAHPDWVEWLEAANM